jgi:6-pyruvoyl-tetrahydropterin synthase
VHFAAASALLQISREHNWTLFVFVSGAASDTVVDCDLQDQVKKKLTKKYSNDVSSDLYRQPLAFRACAADSFIQKAKDPQDISITNLEVYVCFLDVVAAYMIFFTLPMSMASSERSYSLNEVRPI